MAFRRGARTRVSFSTASTESVSFMPKPYPGRGRGAGKGWRKWQISGANNVEVSRYRDYPDRRLSI